MGAGSIDEVVRRRYSDAARAREPALCCPVEYDSRHLSAIPEEVIQRDYGCGDPSRYVREGDTVLDLGSGSGKICFIAAQIAGPEGQVIGVDMNEEMLALARSAAPVVSERVGYENVRFLHGRIQDLALDVDRLEAWLERHPVCGLEDLARLEAAEERLRREAPLVPDASVDLVVSNCVLNLVKEADKARLVPEIFRVLKIGGRVAISDIVCNARVPEHLRRDPDLWSWCISGAFEERELLRRFEEAGFHGIALGRWEAKPFAVVEGIEFRSVTITAHKGEQGPCYEANEAVVYRGPWKRVEDDAGHVLVRGERTAVCARTFRLLTAEPYAVETIPVRPRVSVPEDERPLFDCSRTARRDPRETKGTGDAETRTPAKGACSEEGCC